MIDDDRDPVTTDATPASSRREALRKGAVGAAAMGVAWVAPRIEGLSIRPDHAAAQTSGAAFDLELLQQTSAGEGFASHSAISTVSGLGTFTLRYTFGALSASLVGSAVGINCNLDDVNASGAINSLSLDLASTPGASQQLTGTVSGWDSGTVTFRAHVTCT